MSRTAQSYATPGTFREWLTVDPKPLNLIMELVTLISKTRASQMKAAWAALAAIPGVVHLLRVAANSDGQRKIIAITLSDGGADRGRLHDAVARVSHAAEWHDVEDESVDPAISTWRRLARLAAEREGLARPKTRG